MVLRCTPSMTASLREPGKRAPGLQTPARDVVGDGLGDLHVQRRGGGRHWQFDDVLSGHDLVYLNC